MRDRLQRIFEALNVGLIERETPLKLALLSALAGEHILLLGAHGTAKSVLAQRLHLAFKDGEYFERLLTRFSVPEELFGPLSIKSLENDRYQRLTKHYLPSATVAFIDEIFKANSAILNSLLTILNEREFDNGDVREKIPLISVIGASNELPEDDSLSALYDRFLCRYQVQAISNGRFDELLRLNDQSITPPSEADQLTAQLVLDIQRHAAEITLSEEVVELLKALREYLQTSLLYISDRRWRKVVKLLKVAAWSNGQKIVTIWDCWLLQHCLWDTPEKKEQIAVWFHSHVGVGSGFNSERLNKLVSTWERVLHDDTDSKVQLKNAKHQLLYVSAGGEQTTEKSYSQWHKRGEELLYLSPPDQQDRTHAGQGFTADELLNEFFDDRKQQSHIQGKWQHIDRYLADSSHRFVTDIENTPIMVAKHHKEAFIQGRMDEVEHLRGDIQQFKKSLQAQYDSLDRSNTEHLWLDPDFIKMADESLIYSIEQADAFIERLSIVLDGYLNLPTLAA